MRSWACSDLAQSDTTDPAQAGLVLDLNADVGESFAQWQPGCDAAIMARASSAGIACGFHAGDRIRFKAVRGLAQLLSAPGGSSASGAHAGLDPFGPEVIAAAVSATVHSRWRRRAFP